MDVFAIPHRQSAFCLGWFVGTISPMYSYIRANIVLISAIVAGLLFGMLAYLVIEGRKDPIAFVNVSKELGIKTERINGVAWLDYDNDGDVDFFGTRLYRNDGDIFVDVTQEAGLEEIAYGSGIAGADYNNDGCVDLYVAHSPQNDILFKNNCNGTFSNVTWSAGIQNWGESTGVAWADYDNDGFVDVYIAKTTESDFRGYLSQQREVPNVLYRNNGDGTFTNMTTSAGVEGLTTCRPELPEDGILNELINTGFHISFQPSWVDVDDDGLLDLFVASDTLVSPLYKNNGDGTFVDVTQESGLCRIGTGMGVAVGDYDRDLDLDIYVANTGENYLWENIGGNFVEVAKTVGLAETGIAWGMAFFDADNDADLDLYLANGRLANVMGYNEVEGELKETDTDVFFENTRGFFDAVDNSDQFGVVDQVSSSVAVADYNNDGFDDVFVNNFVEGTVDAKHIVWRNKGNANNWIQIVLEGVESNRSAIGARVYVTSGRTVQMREIKSGSSFLSQNSLWQTFGIGKRTSVEEVRITWPSGIEQVITNPTINEKLVVREQAS